MLWSRRMLALATVVAALLATVAVALVSTSVTPALATGTGHGRPRPNPAVEIGTARIRGLGTVLVNGHGHLLYMFAPDNRSKVSCNRACQKIWPPDLAPRAGVAKAIRGARQALIGSYRNPVDGRRIVTYDGWPLYFYVLDTGPHQDNGQNIALNGGLWWALTPAGRINRTPVSHGGGIVGS